MILVIRYLPGIIRRKKSHGKTHGEFYQNVKKHIAYVHIKDCIEPSENTKGKEVYTYPGEGKERLQES